MKLLLTKPAYSLKDFRLLPGYTDNGCASRKISLQTRLCRQRDDFIYLDLPFLSAAMRAVTGIDMATALAELGGVGVFPLGESIEEQCGKVREVKHYKAGFQTDIITFSPSQLLLDVKEVIDETSYSIFPVTDTGLFHGKLLGIITDKDFDSRYDTEMCIDERMKKEVPAGVDVDDLKEANRLMIQHGHGFLPIVSKEETLQSVVFKKNLDKHIKHPDATVDGQKRLRVGAAVSTHPEDRERIKELAENDVDFLVIDSSDGFTCFQKQSIEWIKENFDTPVIGGNVVTAEAFQMLADAGVDAIKVGMGIGSGCITQEAKATGRGQATAIMDVAKARDAYIRGDRYIPIIADGGINSPADIAIALAMGADTVMMGNLFARLSESPGPTHKVNGRHVKEYWMEGSQRARNHKRYSQTRDTFFEEGINGFVPYAGSIYDYLPTSRLRLEASLSTAGVSTIDKLHKNAILELQSPLAQCDSKVHNMIQTDTSIVQSSLASI
ncbi:MAG: IMP dehydrogenase [Deltaproteobacteria bacterium]|nr:IMP dehydrogenase [Deltaproteobacteria bacterium]